MEYKSNICAICGCSRGGAKNDSRTCAHRRFKRLPMVAPYDVMSKAINVMFALDVMSRQI